MAATPVFSSRAVFWLIAVGTLSFAGAAYFTVFGRPEASTAGANAFSSSAIGHRAFVKSLERAGIPVIVSRNNSAAKAGETALLVVAEPALAYTTKEAVAELMTAGNVLFVLPKWTGGRDPFDPAWLASATLLPIEYVEKILQIIVPDARLRRPGPQSNSAEFPPGLSAPQLIESKRLRPLLNTEQGLLVGELKLENRRVWVLADPDLFSNHGLKGGNNSELAFDLINVLRPNDGAVVFDETMHGFLTSPNLWLAIFQFPLVILTIQVATTIFALVLASTWRFGAPLPVREPFQPGWEGLVNNTANLIQRGGHSRELVKRFFDATLLDLARQLRAPRNMDGDALDEWIERACASRGVEANVAALRRETIVNIDASASDDAKLIARAKGLYRWKQEIVDGR